MGHSTAQHMTAPTESEGMPTRMLMSPFGDILEGAREDAMTFETSIDSPATVGAIIRARRRDRGLSQQSLAETAGVSRKFLMDLEAGHERAELGKTLAIFAALGLSLEATDPIPAPATTTWHGATTPRPSPN